MLSGSKVEADRIEQGLYELVLFSSDGRFVAYRFRIREIVGSKGRLRFSITAPGFEPKAVDIPRNRLWFDGKNELNVSLKKRKSLDTH